MEINPLEPLDQVGEDKVQPAASPSRLNSTVAITVALLATFMGICKVKDDNVVQAMQQAQADKIDHWAFYQARQIREEVARVAAMQIKVARASRPASEQSAADDAIGEYLRIADEQAKKKEEVRRLAEKDQQNYDSLNYRDDQFDLADASLAIAISLPAVTALTGLWWLYGIALIPTAFGILMGLAGLRGWALHPDALVRLLS